MTLAMLGGFAVQAIGPSGQEFTLASEVTPAKPRPVTIIAPAAARIHFDRSAVTTMAAPPPSPDEKLHHLMSTSNGAPAVTESKGTLAPPLGNLDTTSAFGQRTSPLTGASELHRGQDFAGTCGTPVHASSGGTVIFAQWHANGGGNRVEIQHEDGLTTTYNHLEASTVTVGQHVNRGDAIATVGTTGASTGCHLHFEVYLGKDVVDPLGWL
ncbi:M23 family metallopeptidase [Arthrobacter sp. UYCo732]|uniref:M23 family metallopeptidase n=1 Tax=Arthrobacter sp. UYCo732 TaxID=3156336 RepID=UPI0033932760